MEDMKTIYLFDVDGTLTPARQPIDPRFESYFDDFVRRNLVYLISGSDMPKIQAQLPSDILNQCQGVFVCSGAEFWVGNDCVEKRDHIFPDAMMAMVQTAIDASPYPLRAGNHIEYRTGMVNVSVLGRDATYAQRLDYFAWDQEHGERAALAAKLSAAFSEYEISAGGQISIDIVPKGLNKSIARDAVLLRNPGAALCFFGDRMGEGGNDKPLSDVLLADGAPHRAVAVETYEDTWRALLAEEAQAEAKLRAKGSA